MGTRKDRERQEDLWVAYTDMAAGPGHPFYVRLNEVLDGERFDAFVEVVRKVLRREAWASWPDARDLFPLTDDRVFRGHRV